MGLSGAVYALTVFDDGSGPALYAGGSFALTGGGLTVNRVAKWDGTRWFALGSGMEAFGTVEALVVYDDGGGPALYAGGAFTTAGGVTVNHVARWNGTSWSALGGGVNDNVQALAVLDDGSGPALYAGGRFWRAGSVGASRIARWNGSSWSPLGSGMSDWVYALAVYDTGGGPALYAGGSFATAGGLEVNNIAKLDGSSWSPLGPVPGRRRQPHPLAREHRRWGRTCSPSATAAT